MAYFERIMIVLKEEWTSFLEQNMKMKKDQLLNLRLLRVSLTAI